MVKKQKRKIITPFINTKGRIIGGGNFIAPLSKVQCKHYSWRLIQENRTDGIPVLSKELECFHSSPFLIIDTETDGIVLAETKNLYQPFFDNNSIVKKFNNISHHHFGVRGFDSIKDKTVRNHFLKVFGEFDKYKYQKKSFDVLNVISYRIEEVCFTDSEVIFISGARSLKKNYCQFQKTIK